MIVVLVEVSDGAGNSLSDDEEAMAMVEVMARSQ